MRYGDKKYGKKDWYDNIFGPKTLGWEYILQKDAFSSYELIEETEIVVVTPFTLGYGAIGVGRKLRFSLDGVNSGELRIKFWLAKKMPDQGQFWSDYPNKKEFERIMNFLKNISYQEWEFLIKKYQSDFISFDPGNTILKKFIKKIFLNKLTPKAT